MSRRAVVMGRVSRGERQQDPASQLGPLRAACERQGWLVVEELRFKQSAWDEASAADVRRAALAPIVEGRADTLAVWAIDRICRGGPLVALQFVAELERHHAAQLYSLQEPFLSTATADPSTRGLLLPLFAWIAEQESNRKSERLKAKVQFKRSRAAQLGTRAVWGAGHLASDDDVERVRGLAASGMSVRAIAAELRLSKSQVGRLITANAGSPIKLPNDLGLHGRP